MVTDNSFVLHYQFLICFSLKEKEVFAIFPLKAGLEPAFHTCK
jgi:hypothetical protein